MARTLATGNVTHIDSRHTHPVAMAKMLFDTPIYLHSGLGTISYEGNDYLGVGEFGGVSSVEETEAVVPSSIVLQLSGLSSSLFAEALNASNYGDKVTLYVAYRNDDGTLVDDPWVFYRGRVESANLTRGADNSIRITVQHDLAVLNQQTGTKFTDEEQQKRYSGDTAFSRVQQMQLVQLIWGVSGVTGQGDRGGPNPPSYEVK